MLLRLSININVYWGWSFMVFKAMKRVYNYARTIIGRLGRLYARWRSFFGLYTLEPATLPIPCSSCGMNEPSIHMYCLGLHLCVCAWGEGGVCGKVIMVRGVESLLMGGGCLELFAIVL